MALRSAILARSKFNFVLCLLSGGGDANEVSNKSVRRRVRKYECLRVLCAFSPLCYKILSHYRRAGLPQCALFFSSRREKCRKTLTKPIKYILLVLI